MTQGCPPPPKDHAPPLLTNHVFLLRDRRGKELRWQRGRCTAQLGYQTGALAQRRFAVDIVAAAIVTRPLAIQRDRS